MHTPDSDTDLDKTPDSTSDSSLVADSAPTLLAQPIRASAPTRTAPQQPWVDLSGPIPLWICLGLMGVGLAFHLPWLGIPAMLVALLLGLRLVLPGVQEWLRRFLTPQERRQLLGTLGLLLAIAGLLEYLEFYERAQTWLASFKYDEFGSWAEWFGAFGQIAIAVLAVYVAWQQYVISRDLTIKQNLITQQQTIDAYFQGISELALNDEGLLEDWPQERAIAAGRTAALLGSVDASGRAKILRFLSRSRLLTPLKRDAHLGRPILDGLGGYAEDRAFGLRVIDLGVMLANGDLRGQDLRWTDLSEANMVRADLRRADLVKANLSRTILFAAKLSEADFKSTRLFYGLVTSASPRDRNAAPNFETGAHTGAVVENADLTLARRLDDDQRYYLCAWGGEQTRQTIPGGCGDIPNKLLERQ
ncbi:MAG: pentapeptide repeat-containing protein [Cyanobacteria bacterium P01_H01_bin.15]